MSLVVVSLTTLWSSAGGICKVLRISVRMRSMTLSLSCPRSRLSCWTNTHENPEIRLVHSTLQWPAIFPISRRRRARFARRPTWFCSSPSAISVGDKRRALPSGLAIRCWTRSARGWLNWWATCNYDINWNLGNLELSTHFSFLMELRDLSKTSHSSALSACCTKIFIKSVWRILVWPRKRRMVWVSLSLLKYFMRSLMESGNFQFHYRIFLGRVRAFSRIYASFIL